MRKDITIEKLTFGGEEVNKSALARQYGCCWETIDRRFNPEKYKTEKKYGFIHLNLTHLKILLMKKLKIIIFQLQVYILYLKTSMVTLENMEL